MALRRAGDHARLAVIGHSMGGAVALEMSYRNPALVEAIAMLDTAFQAPSSLNNVLGPLIPGLMEADYDATYRSIMRALSLPSDLAALDSYPRQLAQRPHNTFFCLR